MKQQAHPSSGWSQLHVLCANGVANSPATASAYSHADILTSAALSADVKKRTPSGDTPLTLACCHRAYDVALVRLLLERGADANALPLNGVTALDWAMSASRGNAETADAVRAAGGLSGAWLRAVAKSPAPVAATPSGAAGGGVFSFSKQPSPREESTWCARAFVLHYPNVLAFLRKHQLCGPNGAKTHRCPLEVSEFSLRTYCTTTTPRRRPPPPTNPQPGVERVPHALTLDCAVTSGFELTVEQVGYLRTTGYIK